LLIATAALFFLLELASFTWLAGRVRRRPLPFAAAIGFGLLVAWQAVVVAALSPFAAVNGVSLAAASVIPPGAVILLARRGAGGVPGAAARGTRSLVWAARAYGWVGALVIPLAGLLAVVAAAYAPSNWDSMTYHLARVAHWLQNGSVAPYETGILRQNVLAPGAEYVLLGLQAAARSDRLANGPQLLAWLLVAGSSAPLARLAGAPRAVAAWAGPIVATAPMLVLQATSTQNDLIAAALAVAVVAASLPFLHPTPRAAGADVLLLGAVIAAGFLVKVTTIVCTAPVIVAALVGGARAIRAWPPRRAVAALIGGAAIAGSVAGPQIVRMALADPRSVALTAPYVFPLHGEWRAREANLRTALVRHLPSSANILPDLAGKASSLPRLHEDLAANPVQSVFAFAGILLLALGWKRAAPRARWAGTMVLASWVLFQMTFRSNPWISRLETPLFALLPATMGGWRPVRPRLARQGILWLFAALALAFGLAAAIHNASRPAMRAFPARQAADDYYVNRPGQRPMHDMALDAATRTRCGRIGLWIGEDSYDYPLTWRAMQRGIEVRHVTGPDPWPCILVSDRGPPPVSAPGVPPWHPVLQQLSSRKVDAQVTGGVWVR
jgi:hypothetical protein